MAADSTKTGPADFDLESAFMDEMMADGKREIVIRLEADAASLVGILGMMQLALRHPGLADCEPAQQFAKWARAIELRLAEIGPATARVCAMGWSPENDRSDS
jgi:hypothetical protein